MAGWQSGHAAACKAVYSGSIPDSASIKKDDKMELNSIKDLENLIEHYSVDENITINTQFYYKKNLLVNAFKHAVGRINKNKKIFFEHDVKKNLQSHISSVQNFQINNLLKIYGLRYGEIVNENGIQFFKKTSSRNKNQSIGLGIPFSGNDGEIPFIDKQIKSLPHKCFDEIVILTSKNPKNIEYLQNYHEKLKIMQYETSDIKRERFLYDGFKPHISKKKNILFNNLNTDIKVIAHSRILFGDDFSRNIRNCFFEVATPRVFVKRNGKLKPYLDIGFKTSSHIYRPNITFAGESVSKSHHKYFKLGEPYIDGGCVIFSDVIDIDPFDERFDWCESEDVAMSSKLFQSGFFLDRVNNISAISQTDKLKSSSIKARIFKILFNIV